MSKKQDILDAASKLFTENGARATSTKSIAIEADTSEGLIFKHFGSKDNLLEEIIKKGYQAAARTTSPYLVGQSAREYVANMIELPIILTKSNPDFWRMQYKIMPLNPISSRYHDHFMRPCLLRLTECFQELHYENPALEAELLLVHIDGVWKYFAAHEFDISKEQALVHAMKQKYKL
ncbi:TetR/AcrR family transcriptional regulator [Pontibacter actiniarum]|uniref:TetR family transcriptional regulator n=1 Tax=Pontibacter actiniarum TaxID=323450 RepID=A0A1X9YRB1_9BACT|nr:TetR/AcrR family transcriptional regulator [Pontibacter actiniarum]ARS35426.1 TetR family transcriptional regulator [Pontibacter actiniarum]